MVMEVGKREVVYMHVHRGAVYVLTDTVSARPRTLAFYERACTHARTHAFRLDSIRSYDI